MGIACISRRPVRFLALLVAAVSFGCEVPRAADLPRERAAEATATANEDDTYLDAFVGQWDMVGTVMGKPVRYAATGKKVLQGGFVRLHMIDVASPPQYEADVYIGFDAREHDYVAHWLDRFGAAGARVVATGHRDDKRLVMQFPYAQGAFRNTWTRLADHEGWTLLIEAQEQDGRWSTFGNYRLTTRR